MLQPEAWLRGPLERVVPMLMPAAHALVQASEDIGPAALPTNVFGLLCHIAEHTQRHTGQVITTTKIVRGLGLG
jgi:hypothetical protein